MPSLVPGIHGFVACGQPPMLSARRPGLGRPGATVRDNCGYDTCAVVPQIH